MNIKEYINFIKEYVKFNMKGNINPKALIGLLIAVVVLGGTAITIFQGVNVTNLANAPSWFQVTAPIVVGAVLIMWLLKGMR